MLPMLPIDAALCCCAVLGAFKKSCPSVSTHTYYLCALGCSLCVNPYLSDTPLGLFPLCQIIRHAPWLLQDNSLNPGTGDKVTFHVATHLATAKSADKAGGANSKYAGMSSHVALKTCLKSIDA